MEQSLRTFVIPFQGGSTILPQSSVVEVLPFSTPSKIDHVPHWVVGTILWRSLDVPLIQLENLTRGTASGVDTHSRIIMIHTLGNNPRLLHFGLLGSDVPHPLNLERSMIVMDSSAGPLKPGVLSWVQLNREPAFIPDLDAIETLLLPFVRQEG